MRMMQMAIDEIIDMVTVGNRRMSAARTMNMVLVMPLADMAPRASRRIGVGDVQCMLLDDAASGLMVQVAVVQIIDMVTMLNRGVPAIGSVDMVMMFVSVAHGLFSSRW
jgi:hypothetical protein